MNASKRKKLQHAGALPPDPAPPQDGWWHQTNTGARGLKPGHYLFREGKVVGYACFEVVGLPDRVSRVSGWRCVGAAIDLRRDTLQEAKDCIEWGVAYRAAQQGMEAGEQRGRSPAGGRLMLASMLPMLLSISTSGR